MFESKWGLRFFSFILALLLFLSVNNVFGKTFSTENISSDGTKTIKNVPVEVINKNDDLYVSGAPDNVDVELSGPQSKVIQAQKVEDFKVVLDVADVNPGERTIEFQVNGLNKDISYRVYPKDTTLSIEEKKTKEVTVEPNISQNALASDQAVDKAIVSPQTVKVIGGKEQLDRIAYAKASFSDDFQLSDDITGNANVAVFDKNMNKLDVQVEPSKVKLNIKLKPYSKTVKVDLKTSGEPQNKQDVSDINLKNDTVKLYGNRDDLAKIDKVNGVVDLNNVSSNTTRDVQLDIPDKVEKMEPNKVEANITLS